MEIESNETALISPESWIRRLDVEIAALAASQHGIVSLYQLARIGLSPRAVRARVEAGRLHRIHRGVYAVGHPRISREGRLMAAVLAGGPGAVLSHQAAGAHHDLRSWSGRPTITVPSWRASTKAIEIHTVQLPADETTELDGIPITTMARTIFDLAGVVDRHALEAIIREAEISHRTDCLSVPDLLRRHPGRRGAATLKAVLADLALGLGVPKDELEVLFQRFITEEGFTTPEFNVPMHLGDRFIVADCVWRQHRLIVELDGHAVHDRRIQADSDKERDRDLLLHGWRVIRVTWRHLHQGRVKLAADLHRLLLPNPR